MHCRRVIALAGKKGHGKDTVADFLAKQYGFTKLAFAAPLKEACAALFDLSERQMADRDLKETPDPRWGLSPRQLLQKLGTEFVRDHVGPDVLVERLCGDLRKCLEAGRDVVVTDCRFDNEAARLVEDFGAEVWSIDAGDRVSPSTDTHASERGIDPNLVVCHLDNSGTPESLWHRVDLALRATKKVTAS